MKKGVEGEEKIDERERKSKTEGVRKRRDEMKKEDKEEGKKKGVIRSYTQKNEE